MLFENNSVILQQKKITECVSQIQTANGYILSEQEIGEDSI